MQIDSSWSPTFEGDYKHVLSTDNRKLLSKQSRMNKANLSMYSKSLFEKGCLVKNKDGGVEVNRIMMPKVYGNLVEYNFVLDMGDKNND